MQCPLCEITCRVAGVVQREGEAFVQLECPSHGCANHRRVVGEEPLPAGEEVGPEDLVE